MTVRKINYHFVVKIVFFLIIVFIPVLSRANFFLGQQKFNTLKTEHFYIHFPDGIGPIADEIRTISEEAYQNITTRLDWKVKGRVNVVLTDKSDEANGMATVIPYHYILLYISPPDADSSLDHYKDYLRLLFNHEFTHIVHIDMHSRWASPARYVFGNVVSPNGATPAWMREGMAVYEESVLDPDFGRNNSDYSDMVLRTAFLENKFPRIDQIAGLTVHFPAGTGPYIFGGQFFKWLSEHYGEDRMYKFQKEYSSGLWVFSLNNKARRVYGKSFYQLWDEFKADLAQKYLSQRSDLETKGLTSFETVIQNKDSQRYFLPRPHSDGFAYYEYGFDDDAKIVVKPDSNTKERHIKRKLFGQMSFSETGRYLAFSTLSQVEPKTSWSDVYYYDLEKAKLYRAYEKGHVKKSMRARDPDFSSKDGGQRWIVMVRNFLNTDQLYIFDAYEKTGYVITDAPEKTQFSNPRFSPDGSKIVVSERDPDGYRDIVVYSNTGKRLFRVTHDIKSDNHPVFSRDGGRIYFDSYRSGVSNIYEYNSYNNTLTQVTNVLDGVFQPFPSQGNELYVERYSSEKLYIQKFNPATHNPLFTSLSVDPSDGGLNQDLVQTQPEQVLAQEENDSVNSLPNQTFSLNRQLNFFSQNPDTLAPSFEYHFDQKNFAGEKDKKNIKTVVNEDEAEKETKDDSPKEYPSDYKRSLQGFSSEPLVNRDNPDGTKKYHPLPHLLVPQYIVPSLVYFENALLVGASVGRNDPLYRHFWSAFTNYRTDAGFVGAGGTYVYSRYTPSFYLGAIRYAVDWGDVSVNDGVNPITTVRFYEQRWQAYGGVAYGIKKHKFNLAYFYEDRSALTNLSVNLTNMQPYAGLRFRYSLANYKMYANSVSPEDGYSFKFGTDFTNSVLGSDDVNEEVAVNGDLRGYIEMPWSDHHVVALRLSAGWVWGDQQQFGAYRLGGPFGEGVGSSYSSRLFPLRGLAGITYGGDQAFIFSGEYRLPLATNINYGIGTWPIFLDKAYLSFFVDGGDIRMRNSTSDLFSRTLVSAGAEVMGNVVVGYGLPVTLRGGYGIILVNRDRIGTLTDAVTQQSLKYGSVYFQFGTMF